MKYNSLSDNVNNSIIKDLNYKDEGEIRRDKNHDKANVWRPAFVRDIEKILHSPYYNRYCDKTQVFSLYKNDDITRRSLHVQLVSRIARNIGRILKLNLDLIEAIALGHDIGHTPFGHAGEKYLNNIYNAQTGRYFNHNVHSVRVLDKIFNYNISLQTLDGIICHNGEIELSKYEPKSNLSFDKFDEMFENCYTQKNYSAKLVPSTLEGCVVRICDIIAYVGKDRQDAIKARILNDDTIFEEGNLGKTNASIINNMVVSIIENSYGKDYIKIDEDMFLELSKSKKDNYEHIYFSKDVAKTNETVIAPMFEKLYYHLLDDLKNDKKSSPIFSHHIDFVNYHRQFYNGGDYKKNTPLDDIVTDYIASMTDDYLVDLFAYFYPKAKTIEYKPYF